MDHTARLPPEILLEIFEYFTVQQLTGTIEKVCRRWKEVIRGSMIWTSVVYRPHSHESQQVVQGTFLKVPHFRSVDLSEIQFKSSALADHIILCKKLERLEIGHEKYDLRSGEFFKKLSINCLNITYLLIPHHHLSDQQCVEHIATLNHLKTLYMKFPESGIHFRKMALTSLTPLINGCPRLQCVDIYVGTDLEGFEKFILNKMTQLRIIRVCYVSQVSKILTLLSKCTNLEVLRLARFDFYPQETLIFLPMPNLKKMHFGIPSVGGCICHLTIGAPPTGTCFRRVEFSSIVRSCPQLEVIDILCSIALKNVKILHNFSCLQKLRLTEIELDEESMMQIAKCRQLKYLEFRNIGWRDQNVIALLVKFCQLEILTFDGCDIMYFPYNNIANDLEKLHLLIFTACSNVNYKALQEMKELRPLLIIKCHILHRVAPPI